MLIVLIAYLISLSIVILIFAMIILIALHVWICCWFDLTCRFSGSHILLIVFEHDVYMYHFHLFIMACVDMNDIPCTLFDCMLHDYPSFA